MTERTDILASMRVASPCSASWESMEGDARVRFCRLCNLNVYNISELTAAEAEALIVGTEGRLCGRMSRRADGTILTKDCPVGLRAVRRRVSLAAGAAFAAVLGLFSVAAGKPQQKRQQAVCPAGGDFKVETKTHADAFASVSGVVTDLMCARIGDAEVTLTNRDTGRKYTAKTSGAGEFLFAAVTPGRYAFEINAPGFQHFSRDNLRVGAGEAAHLSASLEVSATMGVLVIINDDKPDIESKNGVTVFRGKALTDLPIPR